MKFKAKNYFLFVIPCTVVFILLFTFGLSSYINKISENLTFYVFMFGMMAISMIGIYLAIGDDKKKPEDKKKANFPDMKTNYKHLEHK